MIKINDDTYQKFISDGNKIKIIKLGAKWCQPCMSSVQPCTELSEELKDKVEIAELDIEESPSTATMLNCRSVPYFLKISNKQVVSEQVGWGGKEKLKAWILSN